MSDSFKFYAHKVLSSVTGNAEREFSGLLCTEWGKALILRKSPKQKLHWQSWFGLGGVIPMMALFSPLSLVCLEAWQGCLKPFWESGVKPNLLEILGRLQASTVNHSWSQITIKPVLLHLKGEGGLPPSHSFLFSTSLPFLSSPFFLGLCSVYPSLHGLDAVAFVAMADEMPYLLNICD